MQAHLIPYMVPSLNKFLGYDRLIPFGIQVKGNGISHQLPLNPEWSKLQNAEDPSCLLDSKPLMIGFRCLNARSLCCVGASSGIGCPAKILLSNNSVVHIDIACLI